MSNPSIETISHALLDAARKAGADAADAIVIEGTSIDVDVREGALEHAERSEGTDLGLRVFVGQRVAIVSSSDASPQTLTAMAERAVTMAAEAPEDPYAGLADPSELIGDHDVTSLELVDPSEPPTPDRLMELALATEAAAMACTGVTKVQQTSAGCSADTIHLAATNGFSSGYSYSACGVSTSAIAGEGLEMQRDYSSDVRVFQSDLRSPEDIGREAGERAAALLGARKPPTGHYPVLFDERISTSLIGHLLMAANGASIARGSSWLMEKRGEQILPKGLDLIENPHRPRIRGSRLVDAEGLPTKRRAIVEDGVLQDWTLDLANARKLGLTSTANAARSVSGGVSPTSWNVALTQGEQSREDLMRDMGTGLLVTSMIGSTINGNTGDYSRGAVGFWVENGEIAYPVNECTIASNLHEMLAAIIPANDARTYLSRVVPSLLVPGMTLAGD
jgi:PmbA protein